MLCFAEQMCWMAGFDFIFLQRLLTSSFSLIAFADFPHLSCGSTCRVCSSRGRSVWCSPHLSEAVGALSFTTIGTAPALSSSNVRSFWRSNGKLHLPKSFSGTLIKPFWALISNKWQMVKQAKLEHFSQRESLLLIYPHTSRSGAFLPCKVLWDLLVLTWWENWRWFPLLQMALSRWEFLFLLLRMLVLARCLRAYYGVFC